MLCRLFFRSVVWATISEFLLGFPIDSRVRYCKFKMLFILNCLVNPSKKGTKAQITEQLAFSPRMRPGRLQWDGRNFRSLGGSFQEHSVQREPFFDGGKQAWGKAGLSLEEGDQGFEGPVIDVALKPYDIGRGAMEDYLTWEENLGKS